MSDKFRVCGDNHLTLLKPKHRFSHITPITQWVSYLFDIDVENLSKSTASFLKSEMGVVSSSHVNVDMKHKCNITIHRYPTTKKGETFLIQYHHQTWNTDGRIFIYTLNCSTTHTFCSEHEGVPCHILIILCQCIWEVK